MKCPDCKEGIVPARAGFYDGPHDRGIFSEDPKPCPRCNASGILTGPAAEAVLAGRQLAEERRAKNIGQRAAAHALRITPPSRLSDAERGLIPAAAINQIRARLAALETMP